MRVVKHFLIHVLSSGASSCIITYTTRHLAERIPKNVYDAIGERLYVDDGYGGGSTLLEALQLKKNLIDAMAKGGFSLSRWKANHPALLHHERGKPDTITEDGMQHLRRTQKGRRGWDLKGLVGVERPLEGGPF